MTDTQVYLVIGAAWLGLFLVDVIQAFRVVLIGEKCDRLERRLERLNRIENRLKKIQIALKDEN